MAHQPEQTHRQSGKWVQVLGASLLAGAGGLLPSLSNIAGTMIVQPVPQIPHWGIMIPLGIFFFIGVVLNCGLNRTEWEFGKAIVIGISAPAIITNLVNGVASGNASLRQQISEPATSQPVASNDGFLSFFGVSYAVAQERQGEPSTADQLPSLTRDNRSPLVLRARVMGSFSEVFEASFRVQAISQNGVSGDIFATQFVPFESLLSIPPGTVELNIVVSSYRGGTFSSGTLVPLPERYVLGGLSESSVVEVSLAAATSSDSDILWGAGAERSQRLIAVNATIDGFPVSSFKAAKSCRTSRNGVEYYKKQEVVTRSSAWLSGGQSQESYCASQIDEMEKPSDALIEIVSSSEESKLELLRRRLYRYTCQIKVSSEPVFRLSESPACGN